MQNKTMRRTVEFIKMMIPDKLYIKLMYRIHTGEKLDLSNPITFNEKLQWLKLYDRQSDYINYVDKYEVREIISKKIGEEYLIPLIGVYDNEESIDWEILPNKFVLKVTHGSGYNIVCTDKEKLSIEEASISLKKWRNKNYFWHSREWPYKSIKPRIICEVFLEDSKDSELKDYRFFCFNGEPKFIAVDFSITDKTKTRRNIYDLNWNLLDEEITYPNEKNETVIKPTKLDEMIKFSKILAANIPHARIDFYYIDETIYFGEITLYHQSGLGVFKSEKFAKQLGDMIKLPIDVNNN